jgi:hypothetical protein
MNANQVFQYNIAASGLDVDQLVRQLANYGITNVQVERGPNVNGLSLSLSNPTPQQFQAIHEILIPLERNIQTNIYRSIRPIFGSENLENPRIGLSGSNLPMTGPPGVRIQELPTSPIRQQFTLPQSKLMSGFGSQIPTNQRVFSLPQATQGTNVERPITQQALSLPQEMMMQRITPQIPQVTGLQSNAFQPPQLGQIVAPSNVRFTVPSF